MKLLLRSIVIASVIAFGGPAHAHFKLEAPASWANQDSLGLPLKSAPCGQADPGNPAVATNAATELMTGSTVTITITETIFHPGHYRVALAADQNSLPADPGVHPDTSGPCGTADIMTTPALPVLADNMLAHTAPFSGPQSFQVTLPAGMTCPHCSLQVIEFMSNHPLNVPGGCFYHHCANVSISTTGADGGPNPGGDAGPNPGADAGPNPGADAGSGNAGTGAGGTMGGCSSGFGINDSCIIGCAMLGWLLARRSRSHR